VQYGGHWNVAVHDFDPTGQYPTDAGYLLDAGQQTKRPLIPGLGGVHSSEMFSDAAIEFLNQQAGDEGRPPFFLTCMNTASACPSSLRGQAFPRRGSGRNDGWNGSRTNSGWGGGYRHSVHNRKLCRSVASIQSIKGKYFGWKQYGNRNSNVRVLSENHTRGTSKGY